MKKVILLSHCIFNETSKVRSEANIGDIAYLAKADFLKFLLDNEIGIIQLPCPEMTCYGLRRWGHVKEQFDTPHYRELCNKLFKPFLDQIIDYKSNDYDIVAILGIYGSPSCGIYRTCSSKKWGGELGSNHNIQDTINSVSSVDGSGIFIEEIQSILKYNNLDIPLIDYNKNQIEDAVSKISSLI